MRLYIREMRNEEGKTMRSNFSFITDYSMISPLHFVAGLGDTNAVGMLNAGLMSTPGRYVIC